MSPANQSSPRAAARASSQGSAPKPSPRRSGQNSVAIRSASAPIAAISGSSLGIAAPTTSWQHERAAADLVDGHDVQRRVVPNAREIAPHQEGGHREHRAVLEGAEPRRHRRPRGTRAGGGGGGPLPLSVSGASPVAGPLGPRHRPSEHVLGHRAEPERRVERGDRRGQDHRLKAPVARRQRLLHQLAPKPPPAALGVRAHRVNRRDRERARRPPPAAARSPRRGPRRDRPRGARTASTRRPTRSPSPPRARRRREAAATPGPGGRRGLHRRSRSSALVLAGHRALRGASGWRSRIDRRRCRARRTAARSAPG